MNKPTPSPSESVAGTQFTIDLSEVELTHEEVSALHNKITKIAVETVQEQRRAAGDTARPRRREPYVRIIFVKAIPPYSNLEE
ncbi:MAG TPA: hypothetical protein VN224_07735 [Xanthomonadales bacterium]|nr:hypothetical protein [Xanthomonadales bacterium]